MSSAVSEFVQASERRRQRSHQCDEALSLQLEYVRQRIGMTALVLTDDLGQVVASAGIQRQIQGLANQAPWLVATPEWDLGSALTFLWKEFPGIQSKHVALRPLDVSFGDADHLILSGVGDSRFMDDWMDHAVEGVTRIISTTLH
ncbi:MAG: hypothetical protein KC561_11385 [Myxococcales bacterium]|nr:hypothetical protein [Myxococcales bacterium]